MEPSKEELQTEIMFSNSFRFATSMLIGIILLLEIIQREALRIATGKGC